VEHLFSSLSLEDVHRRFFSSFRPDRSFLDHVVRASERGGGCLVAEVHERGAATTVVAEADFEPLPDGDAELSIVVDPDWRGWLAPFLLDALVRLAADRGFPNLQAEILTTNRPMLALVRGRGFAAIDHGDWTTIRATISTAGRVPTWPGSHDRPRILVEIPGAHWQPTRQLRDAGFDVIACPGPGANRGRCPLLHGEPCPLVDDADVVVYALRPGDAGAEELLTAHDPSAGGPPLVVEVRGVDPPPTNEPAGTVELRRPTPDEVVETVRSLLGSGPWTLAPGPHRRDDDVNRG
jgi:GNAT superfamily N-acetyltransferase